MWAYRTQQAAARGGCKRAEVTGTGQEASVRAPESPTSGKPAKSGQWLEGQRRKGGPGVTTLSSFDLPF